MMSLSADQRQVLATLSTAGRNGVAQALLSARGFDASMIAGLVNRGLAILTTEKVLASGKVSAVVMVSLTEAGRRSLAAED
jgi:DNA-binding MarR family transcriptional regulator